MSKNLPPLPPAPENNDLIARIYKLRERHSYECLNAAVQLAMEAARGEGVLVEHFIELGRRFGSSTVRKTRNTRDRLRLIKGGKD
ncbi:hypothetical protein GS535_04275 [Saccharibacter sp. EH611]|uniref:hypothetical protein n=1 Tax=unclassified Saccharibacter TaxID=2648722 RepID=UPI001322B916|nr:MULTISPECIES: hypothetical protein [unclassified Saccharibacter]MXV35772.1 hypothetical protein [Saccharibacter sp. EH611]MXV65922.1 hypothetical protein [Saccharibacter sp. EH60]